MTDPLPDVTEEYATLLAPDPHPVVAEMDERADREGFPNVGPAVGGWLRTLARAVDARRVFEFGSGFGYSAAWTAAALPADGEIVLTEVDRDELDDARDYLDRIDPDPTVHFEHGDALDVVEEYDGPFDLVLVDIRKQDYREAFEAVRPKVAEGGVVAADNAIEAGSLDFEDIMALVAGESVPEATDGSRGIASYLRRVREDEAFESGLLPLGEGVAVSVRTE